VILVGSGRKVADVPDGVPTFVYRRLVDAAHKILEVTYAADPQGATAAHQGILLPLWIPSMVRSSPLPSD
jgi:hypothetical protein